MCPTKHLHKLQELINNNTTIQVIKQQMLDWMLDTSDDNKDYTGDY